MFWGGNRNIQRDVMQHMENMETQKGLIRAGNQTQVLLLEATVQTTEPRLATREDKSDHAVIKSIDCDISVITILNAF